MNSRTFRYNTREQGNKQEALARFQAAKQKKKECLSQLEKDMKQTYEEKTGKKAEYFFAL